MPVFHVEIHQVGKNQCFRGGFYGFNGFLYTLLIVFGFLISGDPFFGEDINDLTDRIYSLSAAFDSIQDSFRR
ncbi:hypothetical protein FQZ97_1194690 [compost metagenome]